MPIDTLVDIDEAALFSTPDVCRMANISFRQIDYWTRCGIIEPDTPARGSGTQRRFTGAQVRDVAMIGRLRELGVSLEAIEEVLDVVNGDGAGMLVVIALGSVRVVAPLDVADAVADAGAAVVVSPASLRVLNDEGRAPDRCAARLRSTAVAPGRRRGPRL